MTSREKASGAAVFTPPYTPGAPMISLVWQGKKRKAGLSACTVVMPCEQKEDFQFLTKEGFDMESFRYSGARPGDDPGRPLISGNTRRGTAFVRSTGS